MPASGNLAFSSISAGQFSTCGTTAGGMVCWGDIVNGLSGTPLPSLVFTYNGFQSVSVGYNHACAVTVAGSWGEAHCWGNNPYGQVGVDPASAPSVVPAARASFDTTVASVAAQSYYTCADRRRAVSRQQRLGRARQRRLHDHPPGPNRGRWHAIARRLHRLEPCLRAGRGETRPAPAGLRSRDETRPSM